MAGESEGIEEGGGDSCRETGRNSSDVCRSREKKHVETCFFQGQLLLKKDVHNMSKTVTHLNLDIR